MSIFRDIDGVIKSANATEFGLASGVMTNDLSKALEVCKYMLGWLVTVVMIFITILLWSNRLMLKPGLSR